MPRIKFVCFHWQTIYMEKSCYVHIFCVLQKLTVRYRNNVAERTIYHSYTILNEYNFTCQRLLSASMPLDKVIAILKTI